jgi:hypothetical protein
MLTLISKQMPPFVESFHDFQDHVLHVNGYDLRVVRLGEEERDFPPQLRGRYSSSSKL